MQKEGTSFLHLTSINFVVGFEVEVEVEVEVDVGTKSGMGRTDATHTYMLHLQTVSNNKRSKVWRSKKNFIAEKKVGDWILQSVGRVTKTWGDFK